MPEIKLDGGYYTNRSLPAAAQRCQNLYAEPTPNNQDEPVGYWDYETPGLILLGTAPGEQCRCAYTATNGDLYMVYNQTLYYVDPSWTFNPIGTMVGSVLADVVPGWGPVTISDNGINLLMVNGSTVDGWTVDMATRSNFTRINANATQLTVEDANAIIGGGAGTNAGYSVDDTLTLTGTNGAQIQVATVDGGGGILTANVIVGGSPTTQGNPVAATGGTGSGAVFTLDYDQEQQQAGWQGSPMVTYQDSFFVLSVGGTNQFYVSGSENITFDPLDFASKNAKADNIVGVLSCHRVLWVVGQTSYECWYNSGGTGSIIDDFPFSLIPSAFGNWGCIAPGTLRTANNEIYWLSQDNTGRGIVMRGQSDYSTIRVSTHAIENEIRTYPVISDAIAYLYNQNGHQFYLISFPSANDYRGKTWCFDTATQLWHERTFTDLNGLSWRHSISFATNAYNTIVGGDWATSNLYALDLDTYNDYGFPIVRLRSFPHAIDTDGQRRVTYRQLTLFMETGTSATQEDILVPLVEFSANATDGTLLQSYVNVNDLNATFTQISGANMEIVNDAVVGQSDGVSLYQINTPPTLPDYEIDFRISETNFQSPVDTNVIAVIGRANPSNQGYMASVSSDGANLFLNLTVMGAATTTIQMGVLTAGYYQLFFVIEGDAITLSAYRSVDGLWLSTPGLWQSNQTVAIAIFDTTYVLAGTILLGATWLTS